MVGLLDPDGDLGENLACLEDAFDQVLVEVGESDRDLAGILAIAITPMRQARDSLSSVRLRDLQHGCAVRVI